MAAGKFANGRSLSLILWIRNGRIPPNVKPATARIFWQQDLFVKEGFYTDIDSRFPIRSRAPASSLPPEKPIAPRNPDKANEGPAARPFPFRRGLSTPEPDGNADRLGRLLIPCVCQGSMFRAEQQPCPCGDGAEPSGWHQTMWPRRRKKWLRQPVFLRWMDAT